MSKETFPKLLKKVDLKVMHINDISKVNSLLSFKAACVIPLGREKVLKALDIEVKEMQVKTLEVPAISYWVDLFKLSFARSTVEERQDHTQVISP